MTALVLKSLDAARTALAPTGSRRLPLPSWRWGVLVAVTALVISDTAAGAAARTALADAFLAVTVFVAGTLILLAVLERRGGVDLGRIMTRHRRWQVPIAALLGMMPGCGGAIVVATQFSAGTASLGALVATLTATMGDAAFLLLAREPQTALLVFAIGGVAGLATGLIVDVIHPRGAAMAPRGGDEATGPTTRADAVSARVSLPSPALPRAVRVLWIAALVPGGLWGLALAFQVDPDTLLGLPDGWSMTEPLGIAGSLLVLASWAMGESSGAARMGQDRTGPAPCSCAAPSCRAAAEDEEREPVFDRIVRESVFISVWVIAGFLAFDLTLSLSGIDPAAWLAAAGPLVPLAAIAIGMVPGCGPQIVVTSLYLAGLVPLSAQIGNALANDGDALFPALAIAPRAAALASVYSAIPAVVVAGVFWSLGL